MANVMFLVAMIELMVTAAITAGSALLFAYWFRYTCLLILSAKTARDFAANVASAHQLGFVHVQSGLAGCTNEDLSRLEQALIHDYAVIRSLLHRAKNRKSILESRMLQLHYRTMRAWFRVSSRLSPKMARQALSEMCQVVAYLANSVGEAAATA